jgi:hypothetical protein
MSKFELGDWAHLSEIAASFVVVLTLIYVAYEVNLNTKSIQHATYQATVEQLGENDRLLAMDEDLLRLVTTASKSPAQATDIEWLRFVHFQLPIWGNWEYMHLSREDGALSEVQWLALEPYFTEFACQPGGIRFWNENPSIWSKSFADYMNTHVMPLCIL